MLDDNVLLGNTRTKTRGEMKIRVPLFSAFFFKTGIDFSFKSFSFHSMIITIMIKALKH